MKKIVLKINDSNYFEIINTCNNSKCIYSAHDVALVNFISNSTVYDLGTDFLVFTIGLFEGGCEEALANNLAIENPENEYDYIYIRDHRDMIETVPEFKNNPIEKEWRGKGQRLASSEKYSAYLYNKDNEIFLEIVPTYKDHEALSPEFTENDKKFIENYKPYFTIKIDKKNIQEWFAKTSEIAKIMDVDGIIEFERHGYTRK